MKDQLKKIRQAAGAGLARKIFTGQRKLVGDAVSYGQIKIGLNYLKAKKQK